MAGDFQRTTIFGRLTRDPAIHQFPNGGAVVNFALAFTGQSRKDQNGNWQDEPCYLDCKAFVNNQGRGIGDVVMRFCKRGSRVLIDGHLILEKWQDRNTGANQQAIRLVVDHLSLAGDPQGRGQGGNQNGGGQGGNNWDDGGRYGADGNESGQQGNQNRGNSGGGNWDDGGGSGDDSGIPF